jgi:Fur family ferric uptake transcriptional regulator
MTPTEFKNLLRDNSLRVTKSRVAVAEVLMHDDGQYLSPEEIHQKVDVPCDLVSIYRILTAYEEIGLVKKSEFHNQAARYSLIKTPGKKPHHEHYFKCVSCDTIEPIKGCFIAKTEKQLMESGYRNLSHHLEITGTCPTCSL